MEYKVWINYILVKLGFREILPSKIINSVKVVDNGEELVKINTSKIYLDKKMEEENAILRESVCDKLNKVAIKLEKSNYFLKIFDAYRSYENQKKSWENRLRETKRDNPNLTEEEIERITSLKVAKPTKGHGGHQTGGAVDLTIINAEGKELDMGTQYEEYSEKTITHSKFITEEQMKNRKLLEQLLKEEGFVNFPGEWWHYCYGDKMWAAYQGKRTCQYGYIEPKKRKR